MAEGALRMGKEKAQPMELELAKGGRRADVGSARKRSGTQAYLDRTTQYAILHCATERTSCVVFR